MAASNSSGNPGASGDRDQWDWRRICVAANGGSRIAANKAIGDAAADAIASQYPGALREVTLQAGSGTRRLDVLTPQGLAIESKVGRSSLTKATRQQIQRDTELMNDPLSGVSSVEWHSGTSPVTGAAGERGGPQWKRCVAK